jgi:hypothetical protein
MQRRNPLRIPKVRRNARVQQRAQSNLVAVHRQLHNVVLQRQLGRGAGRDHVPKLDLLDIDRSWCRAGLLRDEHRRRLR